MSLQQITVLVPCVLAPNAVPDVPIKTIYTTALDDLLFRGRPTTDALGPTGAKLNQGVDQYGAIQIVLIIDEVFLPAIEAIPNITILSAAEAPQNPPPNSNLFTAYTATAAGQAALASAVAALPTIVSALQATPEPTGLVSPTGTTTGVNSVLP
jgi:hypothetical protein